MTEESNRKKLTSILAIIKIRSEDLNYDASDLFDLFAQPHAGVPINELTATLQRDLVIPITEEDQKLLLMRYGNKHGHVDLRSLLHDAGLEVQRSSKVGSHHELSARKEDGLLDSPAEQGHAESRHKTTRTSYDGDDFDFLLRPPHVTVVKPPRYSHTDNQSNMQDEDELPGASDRSLSKLGTSRAFDLFGDLLDRTESNIDSLADMHTLIAQGRHMDTASKESKSRLPIIPEDGFDDSVRIKTKITLPESYTTSFREGRDEDNEAMHLKDYLKSRSERDRDLYSDRDQDRAELPSSHLSAKEARRLAELKDENDRLKREMRSFDSEFFEQLEDLKYRYSKLQEVVGELPQTAALNGSIRVHGSPHRHSTASSLPGKRSMSPLPLDRLGWAARSSMTAIDKASIHSSLLDTRPDYSSSLPHKHAFSSSSMLSSHRGDGVHDIRPFPFTHHEPNETIEERWSDHRSRTKKEDAEFDNDSSELTARAARKLESFEGRMEPERLRAPIATRGQERKAPATQSLTHRSVDEFMVGSGSAIRVGGTHAIGSGVYAADGSGSHSNIYERRLVFELSQLPSPSQSTNALIHKVVDCAGKRGKGFVTVDDLMAIFRSLGIRMTLAEVQVLATGFARINAKEFCEALQSLLYNLLGEHAIAEEQMKEETRNVRKALEEEDDVDNILLAISEGLLLKEKKSSYGVAQPLDRTVKGLFKHIILPFLEVDDADTGVVSFGNFSDCIARLGATVDADDLLLVAKRFRAKSIEQVPADRGDADLESFRERQLQGSLRGSAQMERTFNKWLATSGSGIGLEFASDIAVEYTPVVKRLVDLLSKLFDGLGDDDETALLKLPWIMREFLLVDTLLRQLESMKTAERRRCLMSLQYALAVADTKQAGDVDGFSVLDALISSGFKLHRLERIQLLRSIEELGGRVEYGELCQVLLRSCADWTDEERGVVSKILNSMGMTVFERRAWLAKLRHELSLADSKQNRRLAGWGRTGPARSAEDSDAGSGSDPGISPAAFLRCLRDCGVDLAVEEEAVLLDCLDTERLAEVGSKVNSNKSLEPQGNWSVPLIFYKSFLSFCSRHCGHWSDIAPALTAELKDVVKCIYNSMEALTELSELMKTLDEDQSGRITSRAFQVACHRSRLLSNLSQADAMKLSQVLLADGGGKIEYNNFLIFLRACCMNTNARTTAAPNILIQLVQNATDAANTLLPLRNWILRNTDADNNFMSAKKVANMLREFSVVYRPEDLNALLEDVNLVNATADAHVTNGHSKRRLTLNSKGPGINTQNMLSYLIKSRGSWTKVHPRLCERIVKLLKLCGTERFTPSRYSTGNNSTMGNNDEQHMAFSKSPKGIETAAARVVMSRLRAFSNISPVNVADFKLAELAESVGVGEEEGDAVARVGVKSECRMIEREVFAHVCRASGVPLSDEDILILADSTDNNPGADRVRCDVIVEALGGFAALHADRTDPDDREFFVIDGVRLDYSVSNSIRGLTEAGMFALKHLRDLLWITAAKVNRSPLEWRADVRAIFAGFDSGGTGFITTEDFSTALTLLRATVSVNILRDIPTVPDGPGLIAYKDILDIVLQPPNVNKDLLDSELQGDLKEMKLEATQRENSHSHGRMKEEHQPISPVAALIKIMRKSLRQFIVSPENLEEAWMCMLRAFKRFDPRESNVVSPRDFCLAVAVLVDDDDIVLTKADWTAIVDHYRSDISKHAAVNDRHVPPLVEYMRFCDDVLNPIEITNALKKDSSSKTRPLVLSNTANDTLRGSGNVGKKLSSYRADLTRKDKGEVDTDRAVASITKSHRSGSAGVSRPKSAWDAPSTSNAVTQGQRSRLSSSYRSTNANRSNLHGRGSSTVGDGDVLFGSKVKSSGYLTTAAGKKVRGTTKGQEYYSAWLQAPEDELASRNLVEDVEDVDGYNEDVSPGHSMRGLVGRDLTVGPISSKKGKQADSGNTQMQLSDGKKKVRKFYKGSSHRVQTALHGVALTSELQYSILELQEQIFRSVEDILGSSNRANKFVYDILEERLRAEDRNRGGSLTMQSFFAAMASLGLPHARIFGTAAQKKILHILEELSGEKNKVAIGDVLAIIFDCV